MFANSNGMSAAYRDLFINTSRQRMEYSDFPMPASYPDFPHHTQIAAYFDDYVDHFGFREQITFETGVEHAARGERRRLDSALGHGETRDATTRCSSPTATTGTPRWPEPAFPGARASPASSCTRTPTSTTRSSPGKRVVVLGMGNSRDGHRRRVLLRRRAHLPGRAPGRLDRPEVHLRQTGRPAAQRPARPVQAPPALHPAAAACSYAGPPERYGLPKPNHRFGEAHPTVSGRILDRIQHGTIDAEAEHRRASTARSVRFVDGTTVEADVVVYCTGYKITFPFFDEQLISAPDNHIELFRRVFHPDIPNVFFIGLLQPLGAIMPLAEAQGAWVGDYLLGDYALPPAGRWCCADIAADQAAMRERYVASKRHTIQVDFDDYLHALAKERAGGRRAGARQRLSPTGAMPTFCRHNRFIERCPICSKTLPGASRRRAPRAGAHERRLGVGLWLAGGVVATRAAPRGAPAACACAARAAPLDDGYRSALLPGLRASADAERLAEEIAFAGGRLLAARRRRRPASTERRERSARSDLERATWICFLIAYLCPLEGEDPFAGIRQALERVPGGERLIDERPRRGPARAAHLARSRARRRDAARLPRVDRPPAVGDGSAAGAFTGDPGWSAAAALRARCSSGSRCPGWRAPGATSCSSRSGGSGCTSCRPTRCTSAGARGGRDRRRHHAGRQARVRRSAIRCCSSAARARSPRRSPCPIEALDLALANWAAGERATLGLPRGRLRRGRAASAPARRSGSEPQHSTAAAASARKMPSTRPPTVPGVSLPRSPGAAMPLCFIEPQDAIRVIAESVGREARRQLVGEVVRAWVDDIPDQELSVHYAKAIADLDEDDLHLLAAWHASLEVGQPIPNTEFLVGVFPSLGENRREALKIAAGFRGEEAFQAGVSEEQALDTVLPRLSRERAIELANECIQLYMWDRLGCDN